MPWIDVHVPDWGTFAGLEAPESCTVTRLNAFLELGGLGEQVLNVDELSWHIDINVGECLRASEILPTRPRPVVVRGPCKTVTAFAFHLQNRLGPPLKIDLEVFSKGRFRACASKDCGFLVNSSPSRGSYCCILCYLGQEHGPQCERVTAPPGVEKAPFELSPPGEVEAKFASKRLTSRELHRDEASWSPPRSLAKTKIYSIIKSSGIILTKGPYIDYSNLNTRNGVPSIIPLFRPDDIGWSLDFDPNFVCELLYEGFYTMGLEIPQEGNPLSPFQLLLIAYDRRLSIWDFQNTHISRNVRKRAKDYMLTVDTAFDEVLLGCMREHGETWMFRGWRWMIRKLYEEGYTGSKDISVSVHSFELWDKNGQLVAGDIGCFVGSIYSSMSGFHKESTRNCGEIQLVLAAAFLHQIGFSWIDLGQVLKYKDNVGAQVVPRKEYLTRLHRDRDKHIQLTHQCSEDSRGLIHYLLHVVEDAKEARKANGNVTSVDVSASGQVLQMGQVSTAEMQIWMRAAEMEGLQIVQAEGNTVSSDASPNTSSQLSSHPSSQGENMKERESLAALVEKSSSQSCRSAEVSEELRQFPDDKDSVSDQSEKSARTWIVTGGAERGGIIVRVGESISSAALPTRLATGSKVQELHVLGNRLHYRNLTGEGPESGWVSLQSNQVSLMKLISDC